MRARIAVAPVLSTFAGARLCYGAAMPRLEFVA